MIDIRSVIKTHKWLIPTVAIILLLLVILFALGLLSGGKVKSGNTANNTQPLLNNVQTVKVSRQATANTLSWQGIIRSRLTVKIAPKLNARIVEVLVHSGDKLKKGDVIARLDDRDLRAAYNATNAAYSAAQVQANQANIEEKRISGLYAKQATTRQNYEAVLSQAKAAQAIANQAASTAQQSKVILNDNVLYAPFDGIVGERLQESGDMGMTNQPVITLLKPDDLRLEVPITNNCTSQIELGMNTPVRIDAIQKTLKGTVDEIAPEIDPQTRSQQIKIRLPITNGLRQGQFGWLELACQSEQQTLLIPASAIVHYGQLETVKVLLEDKQLHIRHIRTGKQYGDQLEVLSGLQENETIVLESGLAQ
ncbi:MAG: efflux RND transporter periplasmic adaptor subunit [Methylococcales bacterium]